MEFTITQRPRRLRKSEAVRQLVKETTLQVSDLVYPLFIKNRGDSEEIATMPGIFRWPVSQVLQEIEECIGLGIQSFILFPAVDENIKDSTGSYGYAEENFYLKVATQIKASFPTITLISDVALDPYSTDGHDGIVREGIIVNDETLEILSRMAVAQAKAGFDFVGPSDMMDGRVGVIRNALDEAGFTDTGIISYTAKYASSFYGPFRDALQSAPKFGDKKTYQMDYANTDEAIREAYLDIEEGADILMVKPGLPYLDIVKAVADLKLAPVAVYNVSGEYSMLVNASKAGLIDLEKGILEIMYSFKRAGAKIIITYFAKDVARLLNRK